MVWLNRFNGFVADNMTQSKTGPLLIFYNPLYNSRLSKQLEQEYQADSQSAADDSCYGIHDLIVPVTGDF